MTRNVAIFVFDEVEVLDMCGPFEVFSIAGMNDDPRPFNVFLVAEEMRPIIARHGFSANPHYTIEDCPKPDILIVPGGYGTRREMQNKTIIDWIRHTTKETEHTLSVCTGSLLLAKAGMLEGLEVTTHHLAFDLLRLSAPHAVIREGRRFLDNGKIITSGGIAAGIDASFYMVEKLLGAKVAQETAQYMEYAWQTAKEE